MTRIDHERRASEVAECVLDVVTACKLPGFGPPLRARAALERARQEFERIASGLGWDEAASFADATCILLAGSLLDPWNSHAGLDERMLRLATFYLMLGEWASPVMGRVSLYTVQCLCVEARTAVNAARALQAAGDERISHTQACIVRLDTKDQSPAARAGAPERAQRERLVQAP